jgi:hypothetical protein
MSILMIESTVAAIHTNCLHLKNTLFRPQAVSIRSVYEFPGFRSGADENSALLGLCSIVACLLLSVSRSCSDHCSLDPEDEATARSRDGGRQNPVSECSIPEERSVV